MRTVVPDAVMRTYDSAEPEDFPTRLPPNHPLKHKIQWTAELMSKSLSNCGFRAIPIYYCTENREHIQIDPKEIRRKYDGCIDWPMVSDMSYIIRKPSLIVDGIKEQ